MSTFYYAGHQQHQAQNPHPMPQSHNHHGRSRRAPRISSAQNNQRQYRAPKAVKEAVINEAPTLAAYRQRFEAGRSFDLDDDLEFCPNLLSYDEVGLEPLFLSTSFTDYKKRQSVTSGSDRSSLSSGSPDSSPLQSQIQPQQITPSLSLSSAATSAYVSPPSYTNNNNHLKIHQPSAIRSRNNAIPIVNPSTGNRIASPPSSISPGMMQQTTAARRW
ncbi:uncharacterized protein PV06_09104 [Exophiala oligosperma]|uniref:Uncharacterized protein n=2 Tax=Chaetothyriales TaxID=34395 RepID=A0A0D2AGS1_9EURO|nr:uncharacterized protein PV06_09104 [Exophiala oligosperma]KAJ9643714.1 hypothetical protein H2204_001859 [Knufia peltigerae]KIW39321.1 hypothetical protein PV06_09104 [Exophiala oligosperma]